MSFRRVFAVGHIKRPKPITLARRCAWGDHWFGHGDMALAEAGADVTHGLCEAHKAEMMAEMDENDQKYH